MKKFIVVLCLFSALFLAAAVSAAPGLEEQLALIADNAALWRQDVDYGLWGYATADLDQDGCLEILSASLQGTGLYTYLNVFSVSPDGTALNEVKQDRPEYESAPDIMQDSAPVFYDPEAKTYYYVFSDFIRNGFAENFEYKRGIWLEEGTWKEVLLAGRDTKCTDIESCTDTFTGPDGEEISAEQFGTAEDIRFGGLSKGTLMLSWNMTDKESFDAITREALLANLANTGSVSLTPASGQ